MLYRLTVRMCGSKTVDLLLFFFLASYRPGSGSVLNPAQTILLPTLSHKSLRKRFLTQAAYQEISVGREYVMSYYSMCNGNVLDAVNSTEQ